MWQFLLVTTLLGAGDFEAQALDGRAATGRLVELNAQQLVLETSDGRADFPLPTLATVTVKDAAAAAEPKATLWVELVDQSGLPAAEYTVDGGTAHVTLANSARVDIPTRAVRWVRFSPPGGRNDKLAEQWSDIVETAAEGDLLVVRQNGQLDYSEGVQGKVDAEACHFEVDKEVIAVKRAKVEGIVYFHPAAAEQPEAIGRLETGDGRRLSIATATLSDGAVKVSTPGGVSLAVPVDEIARLDFTSGKVAYLSDLEPANVKYTPFFGFKNELPALGEFYAYRRDVGFEKLPLQLDGKTYRKGLALQSRTVLSYQLPGKFRKFQATVGIDDTAREAGNAKLEIKADGKTLWQGDVRGDKDPQAIELELGGARRLEIVVDYGDDLDIGDRVDLCEARVTK